MAEQEAGVMAKERKSAFQPAAQFGEACDPAAVRGEVVAIIQTVAPGEPLEREIRQRRTRLADREARVGPALEQYDVMPLDGEDAREQRAGEAAADDRYAHAGQEPGARSREPVHSFIDRSRATRCVRQPSQAGSRSISQRSAFTTADLIPRHRSSACSSCASVGGTKSPSASSRSSSPLPPRTGMRAMRCAPRDAAYSARSEERR